MPTRLRDRVSPATGMSFGNQFLCFLCADVVPFGRVRRPCAHFLGRVVVASRAVVARETFFMQHRRSALAQLEDSEWGLHVVGHWSVGVSLITN